MKSVKFLSRNFRESEFMCRCRAHDCAAPKMDAGFIAKLQALREEWGKPLIITSGVRCAAWNKKINGAEKSQHILGKAADILMPDESEIPKFVALAEKIGFCGIGVATSFVHVDVRESRARWTY